MYISQVTLDARTMLVLIDFNYSLYVSTFSNETPEYKISFKSGRRYTSC
jgi:hypothetical protein